MRLRLRLLIPSLESLLPADSLFYISHLKHILKENETSEYKMEPFHPLDRLINDNSFALLEALVPFVDYPYKRLLVLYIKYKEALALMNCFNDRSFIARQGFDCHPKSTEDFVSDLCNILPTQ